MQNRYPDGQWEEILGGCDTSLFLGCNDMTTATYFSGRSGEVTVGVASIRKNLSSMRMSDYVPDYSETSSVGKRMLLLPDEVLRFPLDQALVIIRGQKVLKVRKFDYSRHPEAKKLVLEKTESHVPQWRKVETEHFENGWNDREEYMDIDSDDWGREDTKGLSEMEQGFAKEKRQGFFKENEQEENTVQRKTEKEDRIERVEDLFTDEW